jgi:hypothetical protein
VRRSSLAGLSALEAHYGNINARTQSGARDACASRLVRAALLKLALRSTPQFVVGPIPIRAS